MPTKHRYCVFLEPRQVEDLRVYASQAGVNQSELLRRILDSALVPESLNSTVPAMSGHFRPVRN